jgi:nucleotide-binding universal stress UspA family protein
VSSARHDDEGNAMGETIVCGVDGSAESLHALRVAAELARRLEGRLLVTHVAHRVSATVAFAGMGAAGGLARAPVMVTQPEAEQQAVEALLSRCVFDAGLPRAEQRALVGDPAERLADLADDEGATLIVVGSRGRGALKAAFLGSVSNSLIGIARCPVLVVPPDARLGFPRLTPAETAE